MSRIQELLEKGFFPSQVPPCFTSKSMADKALTISRQINKIAPKGLNSRKCTNVRPETFSVARIGHSRRLTSLVNPITQYYLCHKIAASWNRLQKHFAKSTLSLSSPLLNLLGQRSISFTPIRELQEHKIVVSAGFKYVLISDISQYFPTIYTHSIGWALDGKEKAKVKQYAKGKYANDLGNELDKFIRYCQSNQTIGLPIGPDTSHIISEIIGTAIDVELVNRLGSVPAGFRFVDDFYLFFDTNQNAEDALAKLSSTISYFELKINSAKTKIISTNDLAEETWKYSLQQFRFESNPRKQKNNINHYFDSAFSTAKSHVDENVMVYAIKRLKGVIIKRQNWELFEAYLCRVMINFPNTLQDIAQIVLTYHTYSYITNVGSIGRTLNQIIIDHAPIDHHSEVAWALWLCKELGIKVDSKACKALMQVNSSICLILAYDMHLDGLMTDPFNEKRFKQTISAKELWGTTWLFAYEAGIRDWMTAKRSAVMADTFFGVLEKNKVSFYDNKRKLDPIFKPSAIMDANQLEELFISEEDIYNEFEFIENEGDYSDMHSSSRLDGDDEDEIEPPEFEDDIPF